MCRRYARRGRTGNACGGCACGATSAAGGAVSVCCCVLLPVPPGASGSPGKGWVACCSSWLWRGARDSCALDVMGGHLSRGDGLSSACGSFFATNACVCLQCFRASITHKHHPRCLSFALSLTRLSAHHHHAHPCTGDNKRPGRHAAAMSVRS
jgi:hypothetical protein